MFVALLFMTIMGKGVCVLLCFLVCVVASCVLSLFFVLGVVCKKNPMFSFVVFVVFVFCVCVLACCTVVCLCFVFLCFVCSVLRLVLLCVVFCFFLCFVPKDPMNVFGVFVFCGWCFVWKDPMTMNLFVFCALCSCRCSKRSYDFLFAVFCVFLFYFLLCVLRFVFVCFVQEDLMNVFWCFCVWRFVCCVSSCPVRFPVMSSRVVWFPVGSCLLFDVFCLALIPRSHVFCFVHLCTDACISQLVNDRLSYGEKQKS